MNTLPADFVAEAEHALATEDRAHLILQSLEVEGLPWESAGKTFVEGLLTKCKTKAIAERVVLFAGHRIDQPDRKTPRFPVEAEPLAHQAIRDVLIREQRQGRVTGIAGGANGGDILFLESCRDLGITYELLLILPEPLFIAESVAAKTGGWVERFHSLASEVRPRVLAKSKDLPTWLKEKAGYSIWARNNLWMIGSALALSAQHFTLAALWDGAKGDGPGGTDHMVQVAQQQGAKFIHLDTRDLFAADGVIRTATP